MTTLITIEDGNNNFRPALAVDAIGGEPTDIVAGEVHVQILTWHGVTPPYTMSNAQVLYLALSDAYLVSEKLMEAADAVSYAILDRQ